MKKLTALLLAVVMIFALAACGQTANNNTPSSNTPSSNTPSNNTPSSNTSDGNSGGVEVIASGDDLYAKKTPEGEVIFGTNQTIKPLDPTGSSQDNTGILMVYNTLWTLNQQTNEYEPGLATAWNWDTPTTLSITLRDDVYFHSGDKFVADDDAASDGDDDYQRNHATLAIARGGASPLGVLPGNSMERNFLPLAYADYIFAIIVEETGLIGALVLIVLYLVILFRACNTSSKYADYGAMLMVMGLALMLTSQAFVSMAVAVGLGPVTGQPLPMVSRGGTSVLVTSLYFAILMCVSREQNEIQAQVEQSRADSYEDVPEIQLD